MARVSKEQQWRLEGMSYALKVAEEFGVDGLRDDLSKRQAIGLPIPISEKALEEAATRMKMNLLETIKILSAYVLYSKNGFCHMQLIKYIEDINAEACKIQHMDDWQKYLDFVAKEADIHLSIDEERFK